MRCDAIRFTFILLIVLKSRANERSKLTKMRTLLCNIFLLRFRDQIYRHEGISLNTARINVKKVLRIKSGKLHTVDINCAVIYLICVRVRALLLLLRHYIYFRRVYMMVVVAVVVVVYIANLVCIYLYLSRK